MADPFAGIAPAKITPIEIKPADIKPVEITPLGSSSPSHKSLWGRITSEASHLEDVGTGLLHEVPKQARAYSQFMNTLMNQANPASVQHFGRSDPAARKQVLDVVKAEAAMLKEDVTHPLRHPLSTGLDVAAILSLGAGTALRGGQALRAIEAVQGASRLDKLEAGATALRKSPSLTPRLLKVPSREPGGPGLVLRGNRARGGLAIAGQNAVDKLLQSAGEASMAGRGGRGADILAKQLERRGAKWQRRTKRIETAAMQRKGLALAAAAKKMGLDDSQQRALRIVAEEVPQPEVLNVARDRLGEAYDDRAYAKDLLRTAKTPKERKVAARAVRLTEQSVLGHEARTKWIEDAQQFLTHDAAGKPKIHPDHPELQGVFNAMADASGDRETMLTALDLMDEEKALAAKTKQAKLAAGGQYVHPREAKAEARAAQTAGTAAEARAAQQGAAGVREATSEWTAASQGVKGAEGQAFRTATTQGAAEREARQLVDQAQARFGAATAKKGKNADRAEASDALRGLVTRQEDLTRLMYEGFHRGHTSEGELHRAQERLTRLTDRYDKVSSAQYTYKNATREQLAAMAEMEKHATDLGAKQTEREALVTELQGKVDQARGELGRTEKNVALKKRLAAAKLDAAKYRTQLNVAEALARAGRIRGADHIEASDAGVFIGSPMERRRLGRRSIEFRTSTSGAFGRTRAESLRESKGYTRERGTESNLSTDIVVERHGEAVRMSQIARAVQEIGKQTGSKVPRKADDIFVRFGKLTGTDRIDPLVRQFFDDPEAFVRSEEEATSFGQKIIDAITAIPENDNWGDKLNAHNLEQFELLAEQGEGAFVSRDLMGDLARRMPAGGEHAVTRIANDANNIMKLLLIHLKGSYVTVQTMSNLVFNLIDQGFMAPLHLSHSMALAKSLGHEGAALVDLAMDEGALAQAAFRGGGRIGDVQRKVTSALGKLTDLVPRRAAFLHAAHRAGYSTPEEIMNLLTNPELRNEFTDVTLNAKRAIIDYGDLSAREKAYLRRYIFIYPWVKGSSRYLVNFLQDHPIQAAVLQRLGDEGAAINDATFGRRPSYDENLVPIQGGKRTFNLASLSPFATPIDIGRSVGAITGLSNAPAAPASEYIGPFYQLLAQWATGRDSLGRPLPGGLGRAVVPARTAFLGSTALGRLGQTAVGGRQGELANIVRDIIGTQRPSKSFPDLNDPYYQYLLGGLYPRRTNPAGINAAAYYEQQNR